ncbi:MAG: hypothetical protein Q4C04_04330 [Clostridia bacterium]|nr:hypothetical protein [Clostridia bacterium]
MYILNGQGAEVLNSDRVERFCIAAKEDAALIVASYDNVRPAVTVARYKDVKEAKDALHSLFNAISEGQGSFVMPDSLLYWAEKQIKDARTKRKGGS